MQVGTEEKGTGMVIYIYGDMSDDRERTWHLVRHECDQQLAAEALRCTCQSKHDLTNMSRHSSKPSKLASRLKTVTRERVRGIE